MTNKDKIISSYQQMVEEKRRRNHQHLVQLGLENGFQLASKQKRQPQGKTRTKSKEDDSNNHEHMDDDNSMSLIAPRRSTRNRRSVPTYTDTTQLEHGLKTDSKQEVAASVEYDHNDIDVSTIRPLKRRRKVVMKDLTVSDEDRHRLQNIPAEKWVQDMKLYFLKHCNNSETNVQRVMNAVNKLVSGQGIQHPNTGHFFHQNVEVSLDLDFQTMLSEASEWVDVNGGDRGNGWLIEHPVKKCWVYQKAVVDNSFTLFYIS